jgi:hypothetical protein
MPVEDYLTDRDGEKPLGVYALYDSSRNAQYVGYSRNIVLAVRVGRRPLPAPAGPCRPLPGLLQPLPAPAGPCCSPCRSLLQPLPAPLAAPPRPHARTPA